MFVTLRRDKDSLAIERKGPSPTHLACGTCRSKKLRCSGHKPDCQRCLDRSLVCEYQNVERNRLKRRRVGGKASSDRPVANFERGNSINSAGEERNVTENATLSNRPVNVEVQDGSHSCPWADSFAENTLSCTELRGTSADDTGYFSSGSPLEFETLMAIHDDVHVEFDAVDVIDFEHRTLSTDAIYISENAGTAPQHGRSSEPSTGLQSGRQIDLTQGRLHASALDIVNRTSCDCGSSLLSLSESFEIENHRLCLSTIDHLLRLNKHGFAKCKRIIECDKCRPEPYLVMLMVTVFRTIVSSFERLFQILISQFEKLKRMEREGSYTVTNTAQRTDGDGPVVTIGIITLKDYEVDASEEPCVFGGLATMQIRTLSRVMTQLAGRCVLPQQEVHKVMLAELERRVRKQLAALDAYRNTLE